MDVKGFLTEVAADLRAAKHADAVQGMDVSQRAQAIDRMVVKVESALEALAAEEKALAEQANRS